MTIKAKAILKIFLSAILISSAFHAQSDSVFSNRKYICPPCYHVENVFETKTYHVDGECPVCGMNLIEQPIFGKESTSNIHFGSGNFVFKSRRPGASSSITVFYHKPKGFTSNSRVLMVVPGAGRNAWDYRDSWIEHSERYNVLVVSPFYPEKDYDFAKYHLAGIVADIEFKNYTVSKVEGRVNKYHVADSDLITGAATQSETWLFRDFDAIFDQVRRLTQSKRQNYDIFGHSAGGQILHRMAMFSSSSKADRIIAANSGSYTLPNFDHQYPLGLKGTKFPEKGIKDVFSRKLILLIGEQDNEKEQRGTMLHTPSMDRQGLGRLSRGKSFYEESMKSAEKYGSEFAWEFCAVEGIGHDYRKMGKVAAELLYTDKGCIK